MDINIRQSDLHQATENQEQWSTVQYLEDAIRQMELAGLNNEVERREWRSMMRDLGILLLTRYKSTTEPRDLDRAVEIADAVLDCSSTADPDDACWLHGLALQLIPRLENPPDPSTLSKAIRFGERCVASTDSSHPHHLSHRTLLVVVRDRHCDETTDPATLNQAINNMEAIQSIMPADHEGRYSMSCVLRKLYKSRFEQIHDTKDIDSFVGLTRLLAEMADVDDPVRCCKFHQLSQDLYQHLKHSKDLTMLNQAIAEVSFAVSVTPADHHHRVEHLIAQGQLLKLNWAESSLLLERAVELIPLVSPRSLDHVDKHYALGELSGLASRAAAAVLNHSNCAYDALKLLELGRNVIAGHLLEMRSEVFALEKLDKELAKRFVSLRDELDAVVMVPSNEKPFAQESRNRRRQQADREFREVIEEIRTRPGFANFLQPPTAEDIRAAASHGPIVVVNASSSPYRCDAFIIETQQIRSLKLEGVTVDDIMANVESLRTTSLRTTSLQSVLEWSWTAIACPVLTALNFNQPVLDDKWSRLWWVLTGPLSHLPMHAAGRHDQGHRETVLDRVISSYASSVKSILYDRKRRVRNAAGNPPGNAVLISMSNTPGHSSLQFTAPEIAEVKRICPSLNLNAVTPMLRKDDVLRHLSSCETFHFAGHGMSDPSEPSKSSLYLDDWQINPLTVGDLRELKLRETAPWLGYLSACSTGEIRAEKLIDESIHLVSAYQLAGFRHVVGTLWEVSDEYCVDMAKAFYEDLRGHDKTDFAVAKALHTAVRAIRDRSMADGLPTPSGTPIAQVTSLDEGAFAAGDEYSGPRGDCDNITSGRAGTRRLPRTRARTFHWVPYIHFGV